MISRSVVETALVIVAGLAKTSAATGIGGNALIVTALKAHVVNQTDSPCLASRPIRRQKAPTSARFDVSLISPGVV